MGLDLVEVILAVEEEFCISLPDDFLKLESSITVGNLANGVSTAMRDQKNEVPDPDAVLAQVIRIINEYSSRVLKKGVTSDSRLKDVLSL